MGVWFQARSTRRAILLPSAAATVSTDDKKERCAKGPEVRIDARVSHILAPL